MADQDDTTTEPETTDDVAADATEAAAETPEVTEADVATEDADATPVEAAAPAEAAPAQTAREQRASKRQAASSARPARTPEERHADRVAERKQKAAQRTRRRAKEKAARAAAGPTDVAAKQTPPVERPTGRPKVRQGRVVSDKADKTITVRIDTARRHRRYEKIVRSSSTLHAHDERNEAHEGDVVRVEESRPLSRTKRWRLLEVLERAR
jgi:small subunit ribosomal protein S17